MVEKYVGDSKQTACGILVVEGGETYFSSEPCCDELYAVAKNGINLTKVDGSSIHKCEYLWVKITDELFSSYAAYEGTMRARHGEQFTPFYFQAKMGAHYRENLHGKAYAYYCIVPRGCLAEETGAAHRKF